MKGYETSSKDFPISNKMIIFMFCIIFTDLGVLNQPCIPGMKQIGSNGIILMCIYIMSS